MNCHNAGSDNGEFHTYAKLSNITTNGIFENVTLIEKTMPKFGGISKDNQDILKCWIENGFPE
jgi:hypothetical protein